MNTFFIIFGMILLFVLGVSLFCWGCFDAEYEKLSIKSFILLSVGIAMLALWCILLKKLSDDNHELYEETHPTEIFTSVPPQIDTIITIKNGIPDTTYTYVFKKKYITQ